MHMCVKSVVLDFAKHDKADAVTVAPAADHLFEVNKSTPQPSKEMACVFYNFMAKALFLFKQACPDMQTAVAFSCSRVTCPDTDDWKKLVRLV